MVPYTEMAIVPLSATMDQVILALSEKNLGCVIVADDECTLHGIVTDGDLKRHMAVDLLKRPVSDIMTKEPRFIAPEKLAAEALNQMTQQVDHYVTSLLVRGADQRILGMIRLQDCLQAGLS